MNARAIRARASWFFVLIAASGTLAAQTETFDLVSFNPPAGWSAAQDQDHITFTLIDNAARTYVMLAVYASAPSSGNMEQDFAGEWKDIVERSFIASAVPRSTPGRSPVGFEYREGESQVRQRDGREAYVKLRTLAAGKRRLSVLLVASNRAASEKQQAAREKFFDSLRLAQASLAASAASPGATTGDSGGAPRPGKGLAGVWMGFKQIYGDSPDPRWYAFFEDGQIFEDIPRAGFVGFNREVSKADSHQRPYWGTYSFASGAGSISKPGARYAETMRAEGAGKLKIDSNYFHQCRSVDGLRLQGAWTSLANPNDPDLDRWPVGQRPILRFTTDGQFADEGVFRTFLKSGDAREDAAGSGTYQIRDFTLILRFADGRVKQLALTGLLGADPSVSNETLFIARSAFRKRK